MGLFLFYLYLDFRFYNFSFEIALHFIQMNCTILIDLFIYLGSKNP